MYAVFFPTIYLSLFLTFLELTSDLSIHPSFFMNQANRKERKNIKQIEDREEKADTLGKIKLQREEVVGGVHFSLFFLLN